MIITISGDPGTGKTSVTKLVADRLGYKYYSMGDLRGKMAMERGLTIDELNQLATTDPTVHTDVDSHQEKLGKSEDNFVIDGWISWHFIPHAFKIFLTCAPEESARRIFEARKTMPGREDEPLYASVEDARRVLDERIQTTSVAFKKYYGIDYRDESNYDAVIDTTKNSGPEQTIEQIFTILKERGLVDI